MDKAVAVHVPGGILPSHGREHTGVRPTAWMALPFFSAAHPTPGSLDLTERGGAARPYMPSGGACGSGGAWDGGTLRQEVACVPCVPAATTGGDLPRGTPGDPQQGALWARLLVLEPHGLCWKLDPGTTGHACNPRNHADLAWGQTWIFFFF